MSVLLSMFRLERVLSYGAVRFSRILGSVGFLSCACEDS